MAKTKNPDEILLRVRRELARAPRAPAATILVAGDPRKSVRRISSRRWTLGGFGIAAVAAGFAPFVFGGWRSPSVRAYATTASLLVPQAPLSANESAIEREFTPASLPPPPASNALDGEAPRAQTVEHFTVEVVNTQRVVEVVLSGPASEPSESSYRALRHELRSTTTGAENPIDPRLIEMLHAIARRTGGTIQVLSAFRAPKSLRDTNYHTRGMAADVRVPGLTAAQVRDLARSLGAHGVGYYPTSEFVHVDVRDEPFFWTDTSGPGQPQEDQHAAYTDTTPSAPRALAPEAPAESPPAPSGATGADAGAATRSGRSPDDGALARGTASPPIASDAVP